MQPVPLRAVLRVAQVMATANLHRILETGFVRRIAIHLAYARIPLKLALHLARKCVVVTGKRTTTHAKHVLRDWERVTLRERVHHLHGVVGLSCSIRAPLVMTVFSVSANCDKAVMHNIFAFKDDAFETQVSIAILLRVHTCA